MQAAYCCACLPSLDFIKLAWCHKAKASVLLSFPALNARKNASSRLSDACGLLAMDGLKKAYINLTVSCTFRAQLWEVHGEQLRKGELELALTGKAFALLQASGAHDDLLLYTRIFARFTPEQKVSECSRVLAQQLVCVAELFYSARQLRPVN